MKAVLRSAALLQGLQRLGCEFLETDGRILSVMLPTDC